MHLVSILMLLKKLIKSFAAKKETVEKKVAEVAAKTTAVAEEKAPVKKKEQLRQNQ